MKGINKGLTNYGDPGFSAFVRGAYARGFGLTETDLDRPIIGIAQTWSELNPCHRHLREVAEAVKRGVWQAGGLPLEFPTISLGELYLSPTAMLFRNLLSMDTEEMIKGQPLDGVVLLGGCDKTLPAQLMGAASAGVPALAVSAGPMIGGRLEGKKLGACSDCRGLWNEYRAGAFDDARLDTIQGELFPSAGHCMVMGTASTMASLTEALGMMLPGLAAIPAVNSRRLRLAEESGRRIVRMVEENLTPDKILTPAAFDNAIRVLMAIGGSTNAVVHLPAIAGRLGIPLPLDRFDELSRTTPLLSLVRPTGGEFLMEDLAEAGGIPTVMKELEPLLEGGAMTITGKTVAENLAGVPRAQDWQEVIVPRERPLSAEGGIAVLRGSLAPDGAVIKVSAASPDKLTHTGKAVVFSSQEDMIRRIDDPDLPATAESVFVLQNTGPVGAPGFPEAGFLPIPKKLLEAGVRDIVRISDARMSGTAGGTTVLHVAPEAAVGGPLALVRDGDEILLDVPNRRLDLLVSEEELARRRAKWQAPPAAYVRGYGRLFLDHVLQAPEGCDFDFLTHQP
ncbi:MAG: dihydroxy-acid dehydratase [bacterium]|nr:dihydroxy-acid dehydratase [bacterium]